MAAINNPEVVWINGRCHRINPTIDKAGVDLSAGVKAPTNNQGSLGAYEEPDLYGEEEADLDYDIQMNNNKFTCTLEVPSVLHSRLIGAKGAVKKRLEYETKCQVNIPRMGAAGPVEVVGLTRDSVISCRQRIDMILRSARSKMRPTHFVGVPFQSPELLEKYKEFTETLTKFTMPGFREDMLTSPQKLHVTFNTLTLLDDSDRKRAISILEEFLKTHRHEFKDLTATVHGLNSFQINKLNKCHVLYAEVQSESLQSLGDRIYKHCIDQDLSVKEHGRETVAMHMTLIKGTKGESFDCEQMFNELRDFHFGTVALKEVHLSQMSTVDPDTGYYKASLVVPLDDA